MNVIPFRPLFFNTQWQKSISPPYDVISKDEEDELKKFQFNITHITLPDTNAIGSNLFNEWVSRGVLYRYPKELLIVIVQEFEYSGKKMKRFSVMAPVQTSPPNGDILTHEHTFGKYVGERKDLMKLTRCQLEPIFLLSEKGDLLDKLKRYTESTHFQNSVEEPKGVMNYVYLVEDKENISEILSSVSGSRAIIADGHHRLQATRELYEEDQQNRDFWKFSLSYVEPADQDSLLILGINRVISSGHSLKDYMGRVKDYFEVLQVDNASDAKTVVLYDGQYYSLIPKDKAYGEAGIDDIETYAASNPLLIDQILIKKILGIDESTILTDVYYTGDGREAKELVDDGKSDFAVIMPQWDKEKLFALMEKGVQLPRKSTYFFPKIPSGLALYQDVL